MTTCCTLTVIEGECVPAQAAVDGPLQIGRDPGCELRLHDERASRFHARIEPDGDALRLTDLGSSNGCWVGDRRIEGSQRLVPGAVFACGGVAFAVSADDEVGDTRVVADDGTALDIAGERATRIWQTGDDADDLAAIHRALQVWHAAAPEDAPRALATSVGELLDCRRCALVLGGRVVGHAMPERLARRLAQGRRARLLELGRELVGQTVARAAVGSAVTAPLDDVGHLVAARDVDDDPLDERALRIVAGIAAELAPVVARQQAGDDGLVGDSEVMRQLRRRIARVAATDATVLLGGESGTGKELVARALHARSGRASGPFVAVNCAAVAGELFEAELFGHEAGAFTGATAARPGRFRQAEGGTLFLDEIGELPERLQPKLLRALQEGVVEPVGGGEGVAVDVRVVAATNRDLQAEVDAGRFRTALFYRLDVVRLVTPPLREHAEDIPELAEHLLRRAAEETGLPPLPLEPAALDRLQTAAWPGNVRQLANVLTRALIAADERIAEGHLELAPGRSADDADPDRFLTLAEIEARHVAAALARTDGNRTHAARLLGVSRPTVLKKIADYGLER